jgi:hypothetical protein
MSERLRFIEHSGKRVFVIDFSQCSRDEMLTLLNDIQDTVGEEARGSVLILADFHGAQVDKAVATRMKEVLVFDRPYVRRTAWVGTEGLPKVFYENFKTFSQRDFPTFKTREEALESLTKEQ